MQLAKGLHGAVFRALAGGDQRVVEDQVLRNAYRASQHQQGRAVGREEVSVRVEREAARRMLAA